jgi:hypothetical protein
MDRTVKLSKLKRVKIGALAKEMEYLRNPAKAFKKEK